jgi:hypothetical protein
MVHLLRLPVRFIACLVTPEDEVARALGCHYETRSPPYKYLVVDNGLCYPNGYVKGTPRSVVLCETRPFRIVDGRFGDYSPSQSRIRRFVRLLERMHVQPTISLPWFEVSFNVSSRTVPAYYRLFLDNANRLIRAQVISMQEPDEAVVRNIKRLDRELYMLVRRCRVPSNPWTCDA